MYRETGKTDHMKKLLSEMSPIDWLMTPLFLMCLPVLLLMEWNSNREMEAFEKAYYSDPVHDKERQDWMARIEKELQEYGV